MTDYKAMYFNLFNAVTDAICLLQEAQLQTEELYISAVDEEEALESQ